MRSWSELESGIAETCPVVVKVRDQVMPTKMIITYSTHPGEETVSNLCISYLGSVLCTLYRVQIQSQGIGGRGRVTARYKPQPVKITTHPVSTPTPSNSALRMCEAPSRMGSIRIQSTFLL